MILNVLTTEEHVNNGNIDSLITSSSWEALAYWDMSTSKEISSIQEAVPDRYTFGKRKFQIDFMDPDNPGHIGTSIDGYFQLHRFNIELYKDAGSNKHTLEIWYIDPHYLVLEIDGLRIFLTHQKSRIILE